MNLRRIKADFKFCFINRIVIFIPSWNIRRCFLKLFGLRIGKNSRINMGTVIIQPESIIIGERTTVNENCHLDGRGGLTIGNDVSISIYSKIISASHYSSADNFQYYEKAVTIEDNVWIGCGAVVLDGSNIRKGAIIGAGCVFKGDAVEKGIYIGNPAKFLRDRNITDYYKLNYNPYFR